MENKLTDLEQQFVLHWGEMGTRWGINRTVAQIFALLYISPKPLNAETIAATLSIARSNVSTSLHELQGWRLIRTVHVLGDRRDHFETLGDVWELFQVMLEERKRRELDPTLAVLRACVKQSVGSAEAAHVHKRLAAMLEFFETAEAWHTQLQKVPGRALLQVAKSAERMTKLLTGKA